MEFNDDFLRSVTIEKQADTLNDIAEIVENFYDLGSVEHIEQIHIGETNFSYFVTLAQNGSGKKYFAQLYNGGKSLADVKHELALREYFMRNRKTSLKCALHYPTKDGGYTVKCYCPEIKRERYFCIFDFLEGDSLGSRDEWAFGRMTEEKYKAYATGIAYYHIGAYGFKSPVSYEESSSMSFEDELKAYKSMFTDELAKMKEKHNDLQEAYRFFTDYQPRLLELLEKYTERYETNKNDLVMCTAHMDPGANNYMFDKNLRPVGVCDLDWSQEHLRLFDITWAILETFCEYDFENLRTNMNIDKCVDFVNAYNRAIENEGNPLPGRMTEKEKEMLPEIFQLVAMRFGFYNPLLLIATDNPTASDEYELYWGNWGKTAIEFVEDHMEEFKNKLLI